MKTLRRLKSNDIISIRIDQLQPRLWALETISVLWQRVEQAKLNGYDEKSTISFKKIWFAKLSKRSRKFVVEHFKKFGWKVKFTRNYIYFGPQEKAV